MIYLYLRVSTEKQEREGNGLDVQRANGEAIFKGQKYEVVEDQCSGFKEDIAQRPKLQALLERLREGDMLWVDDESRLSRDPGVKFILLGFLRKSGITFQVGKNIRNPDDHDSNLLSSLWSLIDFHGKKRDMAKMRRGRDLSVLSKGRWGGGITPLGYTVSKNPEDHCYLKLIPAADEVKIYKQMVKWLMEGSSTLTISRRLNELKIPTGHTKKGKKGKSYQWHSEVVRDIFRKPTYKGQFHYKGKVVGVPSIISDKEWDKIQRCLDSNKNNSARNTRRLYLLRGLLCCSRCGCKFFGRKKVKNGENVYRCLGNKLSPKRPHKCGIPSLNIDRTNDLIWSQVRQYILNFKKLRKAIEAQKDTTFVDRIGFEAELANVRKKLGEKDEEVRDLLRSRGRYKNINEFEIDQIAGVIKNEKNDLLIRENELLKRVAQIDSMDDRAKEIETFLSTLAHRVDDLTDQEKYDVLRAIISKVIISYDQKHNLDIKLAIDNEPSMTGESVVSAKQDKVLSII